MAETLKFESASKVGPTVLPSEPYFVIVSADFEKMPPDEMGDLADLLVATKAMWVAAHGIQGTLFDDAVDFAFVDLNMNAEKDLAHVMTTWHDDESIEDVVEFLETVTPMDDWKAREWQTVVIRIERQVN